MKLIRQDLRHLDFDEIEIVCLNDLHIGSKNFDKKLLQSYIDYIKSKNNVYVIVVGDYIDNPIKSSKSFEHGAESPQKEFETAIKMLSEIPTSRWLAFVTGNHSTRTWREAGIDID